jgi:hypothetical protein
VATAGWSYPDWKGQVYPTPQPRGFEPLSYLAQYVDAVEVNSTFDRMPVPSRRARAPERRDRTGTQTGACETLVRGSRRRGRRELRTNVGEHHA